VNCREFEGLIDAYVDGELDPMRSVDVETHLPACPGCMAAVERREALQAAFAQAPYFKAPDALRRRVMPPAPVPLIRRLPRWLPVAASVAALGLVVWRIGPASPRVDGEVVAAHVRSLQANHLMDVISTDRHTVKPWFAGKLDFAPVVEDFSAQGFALEGGRLDYVDGRPVAALVYKRRQHTINVFTWPDTARDSAPRFESLQGYNVAHWAHSGMDWWAVSDLGGEELKLLCDRLNR
jgi:anti-sigma factor RsiW